MRIGVPKETKNHEYRVGLTPASVAELTAQGHEVWVETNAGEAIGFSNDQYRKAGAKLVNAAAAFSAATPASMVSFCSALSYPLTAAA